MDRHQLKDMPSNQAQEFLFQRIRELLPPSASLTDVVSEILHVSSDSAYRRIRSETPLVLEEAQQLCKRFGLSLDQVLNIKNNSVLFENVRINNQKYSYEKYLSDLLKLVQYVNSFQKKEIIWLTKDMPLFHNFYFKPLIAFRYFFWMKAILQNPEFATRAVDLNGVSPEIEHMSREFVKGYTQIPSTEIWNTECVNSAITQIEFYRDTGLFSSAADIKAVYESLKETILHLKAQVECGTKFLPGENPQTKKPNFNFFFNRVILGDNTILVTTDNVKTAYLNYEVLNYMMTRDENFCNQCNDDLRNLMRRATVISQTSERQRNIFFGILLAKIEDRLQKI
ncbi:MAG TPA: hypothetical protein VFP87_06545 [Chitinophagaceae bacterium]|nr:hypothetical protein [Chitinophagaceae bacterium]